MFSGLPVSFAEFFAFILSLLSSVSKQTILFINIHSHLPAAPHEWTVQNLYQHFEHVAVPGNYSTGLHPWYLNEEPIIADIEGLKKWSAQPNVLAIGECGLDRACRTDFRLQKDIFLKQVQWANELQKPLIIHCVKAHEDV
ncbi:MAG: TatD family hydrolase, partial [Lacibacter sp.]